MADVRPDSKGDYMLKTKCIVVGTGGMARWHIRTMVAMRRTTSIVGLVEPNKGSQNATARLFSEINAPCPPFYKSISELVKAQGPSDAAFICSPHKFHFENARDCLRNGIDICLEKPMVMNTSEARQLICLRNSTGRLVVVAFPGSLSPAIAKAKALINGGAIGRVTAISAFAHQHWKQATVGTWRQNPEISGGGFLFDTGSHMINTVVDLLAQDVVRVCALLDNSGTPVEINAAVSAVSQSGVAISLAGAGDSIQCCSQVTVFGDRGVLKTGMWGEYLFMKKVKQPEFTAVPFRRSRGPWETFLKVREGTIDNPCPPEVGLRFAKLMDMIYRSDKTGRTIESRAHRTQRR